MAVLGHVELEEDCTSRFGLSSSIYARCDECGMSELLATGYHKSDATLPNTIQGKDLNRRVVYGAFEMGLGREGIAKLCEVLDMPFSISIDTWYRHEDALLEAHTDVVREELAKNRAEARKLAFLEMGEEDNNENAIAEVPVSFDGTWSRRGYSANHCVSFVISAVSGKVLDFEVISKVCSQCNQKKANCTQEAFEDWLQTHDCQGSYGGSSPSMEMECAKRLWGRSEQFGLMYKWMISDGDSKSYSSIWNIYGACDTCNRFEKMEPTSKEYISWTASSDYKEWEEGHLQGTADCNRVIKLDCIGHVQKRLGKALYDFQRSTTKLEDGKPVKGRNGRLTKTAIEKLKKYYGKAVRNNVNRGISTTEERDRAVANMRTDIKAGLYHCLKLPLKERHQYCPSNSWCKYKKGLPCPDKPHHLDPVFKKCLKPIYDRLSDPALLARCLPGYTQNSNESINALVWNKCPKSKWHGRKRVLMATCSASLHFSSGASVKNQVMLKAGLNVGDHTRKEFKRRDSKRVKQAEARVDKQYKNYRIMRRQAKQRDEELRSNREGVTYEAGGFNDLGLNSGPSRKRKKK